MLRLLLLLLLLSDLCAQRITTTSYVQSSLGGPSGNSIPFGCSATGLFAQSRTQILIPPQFLPGPNANLTGIAVHSQTATGGNGTLTYPILTITVSPTTAANLSPTFANNLILPSVVLQVANLQVQWVANSWTWIQFSVPYVHDGRSGLVIEIQKVVNPTLDLSSRTIQNAGRSDLPRMINAFGGVGTGAYFAPVATVTSNYPLSMQLRWTSASSQGVPTLKLRSDAASSLSNQFAIGRTLDLSVQGAPGATAVHLVAPQFPRRAVSSPLLDGLIWLESFFVLSQVTLPANGDATLTIPIPNDAALVGAYVVWQSVVLATPGPPWKVTNAADCVIRS